MTYKYPISRYLNVQVAYNPAFSSDGERVVFLSNITGVPQVWQVKPPEDDGELHWPDQLTFETERVQTVITTPGDPRVIYARDKGGNEVAQLYLLDPATGQETCLTEGYEDAMHIPGEWSQDGKHLLFAANRRDPARFDLYMQRLDGSPAQMIWQNDMPGYLFFPAFSPDKARVVVTHSMSSYNMRLYEVSVADATACMVSPDEDDARYVMPTYTPDGRAVVVASSYREDFVRVMKLNLDTGDIVPFTRTPDWDVEYLAASADHQRLAYVLNVEGYSQLYLHDLETDALRTLPGAESLRGVMAAAPAFSLDGQTLAFSLSQAQETENLFLWDLEADTVRRVTRVTDGGIDPSTFVAPELVQYTTFDNDESGQPRQIPAWFFRPYADDSESPFPVVVVAHGGPEGQSRPGFSFLIQYLVNNGYGVFLPNVRGSNGYGKAFSHLDDVEKRMDSVADLAYGAEWLREQSDVDGDRLVIYGGSYGGFMVLSALTTYPHLWVAGVDIVGISNFVTFLENTSAYRRAHREVEYGSLERDRDFLESVSPSNHLENIRAPLMVIHGANDPRVPLSEAEQIVEALESHDVPVKFLMFDDEGHGIVKLKNRLVMYPQVIDFLAQYV